MGFIRDLYEKGNAFLEPYIGKIIDFISNFFASGEYLVLGCILFFLTIVILIGLIRWLRKTPKLFLFFLIIIGIIVALGIFSQNA